MQGIPRRNLLADETHNDRISPALAHGADTKAAHAHKRNGDIELARFFELVDVLGFDYFGQQRERRFWRKLLIVDGNTDAVNLDQRRGAG